MQTGSMEYSTLLNFWALVERLQKELKTGTPLLKIKSSSRLLKRTFYLDAGNMTLYYEGSRKKNKDTKISISDIREIREGEKDYSKKCKNLQRELCFVVVLGASHKILYLMADKKEVRDKWVRALRFTMQMEQLAVQRNESDRYIREAFNMADKNGDGNLDFEEVLKLLKVLNANVKKKYAKEMFDAADKNKNSAKSGGLDREEFVEFYNSLTKRTELEQVFIKFAKDKGQMTVKDLLAFLKDEQKVFGANVNYCRNIVEQFEPDPTNKRLEQLSSIGFRKFLTSEGEQLFSPSHRVAYQNMKRPMTNYFIASSHNTYLSKDQLKGPSQVEMYIQALKHGCRCVELDCWDGPDDEPIIYHGYTLTSKILFRDVINAINDYAFQASPYPVILSLENHCSVEQQNVMADIMKQIFGNKIWCPDTDLITTPSPEELRNKIVIKGKRLPAVVEQGDDVSDEDEAADIPADSIEGDENENTNRQKDSDGHKKIKLSHALSQITAMQSVGFKGTEKSAQPDLFFNVISLGENKVEKLIQSDPTGLNAITHHRLIRTYPAGSRTDSSNYNPVPMWNHGCQVVALNYQTGGEPMQLNHGRFLDNGGVGYVLKPSFLMSEDMFGVISGVVSRSVNKTLKITIISGYQIPKPNDSTKGEVIDPFIKIEVFGVPSDAAECRTKVIEDNGLNPRWDETFIFKVRVPELALLRFTVKDEDRGRDDFIGYYCLPVLSIQEGFRHFPLYDKRGNIYSQSLIFTHVTLTNN
ncbi:hypothetical protein BsWGS_07283 [Bradybaena similaris]